MLHPPPILGRDTRKSSSSTPSFFVCSLTVSVTNIANRSITDRRCDIVAVWLAHCSKTCQIGREPSTSLRCAKTSSLFASFWCLIYDQEICHEEAALEWDVMSLLDHSTPSPRLGNRYHATPRDLAFTAPCRGEIKILIQNVRAKVSETSLRLDDTG